jgi:hypothetical protein
MKTGTPQEWMDVDYSKMNEEKGDGNRISFLILI